MIFKFTLSHDVEGTQEINAPNGWDSCVLRLERHEDFNSLFEYFDGEFIFYGTAIEFIYTVLRNHGPDTTLNILIEASFDDETFQFVFSGQLALDLIRKFDNNTAMLPIVRNDFSAIFKSRLNMPVDLMAPQSQDGTSVTVHDPITLRMSSQVINKTSTYEGYVFKDGFYPIELDMPAGDGIENSPFVFTTFHQAQTILEQDEIEDTFSPILDFQSSFDDIAPNLELPNESGDLNVSIPSGTGVFNLHVILAMESVETDPSSVISMQLRAKRFYQINDDTPVEVGITTFDTKPGPPNPLGTSLPSETNTTFTLNFASINFDVSLSKLDTFKMFVRLEMDFNIDIGADPTIIWGQRLLSVVNYTMDTTYTIKSVYQDTDAQGFWIHDAGGQIMDRIIGGGENFYSDYLGSPNTQYRSYAERGCGARYGVFQGLQIRRYDIDDKPFAMSMMDWWKGINPILNLGLGYEQISGVEQIRVEERTHFYNPEPSVYLNKVKIEGGYDQDKLFNKINIGYNQWKSDDISGIDDPQTKHVYSSVFRKMGKEITIQSDFVAASLAIETTRRSSKEKSADYKFDNTTFIISINEAQVDGKFPPELDENFAVITGLLNPETRYNSRLTPKRNLLNHLNFIAGGLQDYPSSELKFQTGEGNFDMMSNLGDYGCGYFDDVFEKGNIPVGTTIIHWGLVFDVVCADFDWEDYLAIRENRKKGIAVSQTDDDHVIFFIKNLAYQPAKGTCTIQVWPFQYFEPEIVEQVPMEDVCESVVIDECDQAYLTEDSFEFETENEECLILE